MRRVSLDQRAAVAEFLMDALPRERADGRDGWDDMAMTAWQFGCMALVSLGYAREEPWGASGVEPHVPEVMPRWDDICTVVLAAMGQHETTSYRNLDGSVYVRPNKGFTVKVVYAEGQEPKIPEPNIRAARGCGPAFVSGHAELFERLGLVADGPWTPDAEFVLWRAQPCAWDMAVPQGPRFATGLARCLETMPEEIVEALHDLTEIDAADGDASVARQEAADADLIARYPAQGRFERTVTREGQFRTLVSMAGGEMDGLFFRRWRLEDSWLGEGAGALALFHDPLAQQMRAGLTAAMNLSFPQEVPT
jgi:pellino protein